MLCQYIGLESGLMGLSKYCLISYTGTVIQQMKELFDESTTAICRLWKKEPDDSYVLLKNLEQTLFGVNVDTGQVMLLIELYCIVSYSDIDVRN